MKSISRHIMPLVMNSLGSGHTHTRKHTLTHTDNPHRIDFKKAGARRPQAGTHLVEKCEENGAIFRNTYLANYYIDFLKIWYMELHIQHCINDIKCVNLIEIAPVVIEIQGVEYGKLVVPENT